MLLSRSRLKGREDLFSLFKSPFPSPVPPPFISSSLFIPPPPTLFSSFHLPFSPRPLCLVLWGRAAHERNLTPAAMTNGHLKRPNLSGRTASGTDRWRKNILEVKETNDTGELNGGKRDEDEAGGDEDSSEERDWRILNCPCLGEEPRLHFEPVYCNLCVLPTSYQRVGIASTLCLEKFQVEHAGPPASSTSL